MTFFKARRDLFCLVIFLFLLTFDKKGRTKIRAKIKTPIKRAKTTTMTKTMFCEVEVTIGSVGLVLSASTASSLACVFEVAATETTDTMGRPCPVELITVFAGLDFLLVGTGGCCVIDGVESLAKTEPAVADSMAVVLFTAGSKVINGEATA